MIILHGTAWQIRLYGTTYDTYVDTWTYSSLPLRQQFATAWLLAAFKPEVVILWYARMIKKLIYLPMVNPT